MPASRNVTPLQLSKSRTAKVATRTHGWCASARPIAEPPEPLRYLARGFRRMDENRSDFTWLAETKPMEPAEPSKNDDA